MKLEFLILTFVTTVTCVVYGQTARFANDGTLVISDGSHQIRIHDISERVDHVPIAPCVHAIQKRNSEYFVVVTTSRWTRGYPPKSGGGGCGAEAFVRWFHVVVGKITNSMEGRYESWSDNREGHIEGWIGSLFTVTTEDLLEDKLAAKEKEVWQKITYTYDSQHPENGIKEVKDKPHE